jgi:hypothetical protein
MALANGRPVNAPLKQWGTTKLNVRRPVRFGGVGYLVAPILNIFVPHS